MVEQQQYKSFPLFKTKVEGIEQEFDLTNPQGQKDYFVCKAGKEIEKLREYLKENTFISYLLGKKNAGKGTYSKMFAEVVAKNAIAHFSVGDMVRGLDAILQNPEEKKDLIVFLEKNYRGWAPLEKIIKSLENRSTKDLLSTELILGLMKREILKLQKKAIFIDGLPRNLDQISYSLFFRDLVGYRDDPDFFILIDVPTSVIDERIKWRRVCPVCQTSRSLKLLITSKIGYRSETKEFYLMCDNPACTDKNIEMTAKEGDELGTAPIRERLEMDAKLIDQAFSLHGIPKILLRNTVPVEKAKEYIDDYEITPEYVFEWDGKMQKVVVKEKPWIVKDDEGVPSYSLLPQAVVVSFIKQMVQVLGL